jgi:hypothetical protein
MRALGDKYKDEDNSWDNQIDSQDTQTPIREIVMEI